MSKWSNNSKYRIFIEFLSYICRVIIVQMKKTRIEIHLTPAETKQLDAIAKADGRSRKNYCETLIRKLIESQKKK